MLELLDLLDVFPIDFQSIFWDCLIMPPPLALPEVLDNIDTLSIVHDGGHIMIQKAVIVIPRCHSTRIQS